MIAYVTLGSNNFEPAAKFYDALLTELNAKRLMKTDRIILWGTAMNAPMLSICKPYDGTPATCGNGVMVALAAGSPAQVDSLHRKALELGGSDEGAPGPRADGAFYIGYFRDLDGNKLNFFSPTQ